jgi:hypothetical protein
MHKAVCCGERRLFKVGHDDGVLTAWMATVRPALTRLRGSGNDWKSTIWWSGQGYRCTLVQVVQKAMCRGESGLFEVGHGNGVLRLGGHCEAGPGPSQR